MDGGLTSFKNLSVIFPTCDPIYIYIYSIKRHAQQTQQIQDN